jgi:hypothetical protein
MEEQPMIAVGLAVTLLGFVIAVASLGVASSTSGRLVVVLAGIAVSLVGSLGILNQAFLKNALWKK